MLAPTSSEAPVAVERLVKVYKTVTAVDGISVPVGAFVQQDVALRRNWATVPGGARLASATDDASAGAGCGAAAAVDGDRTTGWSASASHPPTDPPTLTVELPAVHVRPLTAYALEPVR